ncbi:MFS transporter [Legionella sp. CNM-4043-24]|uniref:MFS transporter n=1 Tax=Legionella sp. CNM-4043-24 TaxID=3421646 RepID=UPI00403AEDB9
MIQFAWRIPFLMSLTGCLLLLFIRSRLPNYLVVNTSIASGYLNLVGLQKRRLLSVFVVSSLSASAFYITFVHMPTWLSSRLDTHSHQQSLLITLIPLLIYMLALPISGILADKIGFKKQIKIASTLYLLCSYAIFAWLPHLSVTGCMLVLALYACIQALLNSVLPAYIVSGFRVNQRGKALAISYSLSLTLFGGLMPYLLLTANNHINPGIPISVCAALCFMVIFNSRKNDGYLRSQPVC